jgi:hypothetical protein
MGTLSLSSTAGVHLKKEMGMSRNATPDIYSGRVGHDVSEGFCSCGGFHRPEDGIRAGTKTVAVDDNGKVKIIEWECSDDRLP